MKLNFGFSRTEEIVIENDTRIAGRRIKCDKTLYTSVAEIEKDDDKDPEIYSQEFINTATPNGMSPHLLNFKVNSVVILLRNLNHTIGLCNGTRLIVKRLL